MTAPDQPPGRDAAKLDYAWNRWSQACELLQASGLGQLGEDLFDATLPRVIAKAQRSDALVAALQAYMEDESERIGRLVHGMSAEKQANYHDTRLRQQALAALAYRAHQPAPDGGRAS